MLIRFSYNNTDYTVPGDVYNKDGVIKLPNGQLLEVGEWLETSPVQVNGLTVIGGDDIQGRAVFEASFA